MCTLERTGSPVKEFYLESEVVDMKSDRFSPLTKPRSVHRQSEKNLDLKLRSSKTIIQGIREFDLENGDIYDLKDLRPLETKQYVNLEAYPHIFETDYDVLCWASALMSESPLGYALMQEAEKTGWRICLSDLGTNGFHLDAEEKIIELDHYGLEAPSLGRSSFFRTALICVFGKALRDIWHENRWGAFEKNFKPEAVMMLERARAADTDSVSTIIGWELRGAGYNDIWRHILGSEDSDMAQVLTNILERYPTALYNGMAMAHVFRQWYSDNARIDALDHSSLEHMDFAMRDQALKFGDKNVSALDFENLSALPDGTVYLKELGETVSRDPFFSGLNDPINQAHLFQIVYDSKVTYVDGIPFRDAALARKFFKAD
ncbi:MAG: DUF6782 family putative metallopeptidase [Alphaproteobacteria bacterium]|nr:hypothetical protein [Alphaproteobacteria bacterium]